MSSIPIGLSYEYFRKKYKFDEAKDHLGSGGFGSVYRAIDTFIDRQVAIKYYSGRKSNFDVIGEIKKAIGLEHPNLVRYYNADYVCSPSNPNSRDQVAVIQFVNGGNLLSFISKQSENPPTSIYKQLLLDVLAGLNELENHQIIHQDIKPENILIKKDGEKLTAKISDFGLARKVDLSIARINYGQSSNKMVGSPPYMAPELILPNKYAAKNKFGKNIILPNVDLWALGVIVYLMFMGKLPFGPIRSGTPTNQIFENILTSPIPSDINKIPRRFQEIVKRCLVKEASKRTQNVNELIEILNSKGNIIVGGKKPKISRIKIHHRNDKK